MSRHDVFLSVIYVLNGNLDQLQKLSIRVAERLNTEDCIFLFGEIGVGKTTFVRYLINYLQKKNDLKDILSKNQ